MKRKDMHLLFVEQVILTLDKKDKGNYYFLIGMGTLLNFNINKINEIIEIVRDLIKVESITKEKIIEFIFHEKPSDDKYF